MSAPGPRSPPPAVKTWTPLRHALFRNIWLASQFSNLGTWMHEVGAAWLMTDATSDPRMVALVSAASNLPVFLLALPAGALSDLLDRRKVLMATQLWMTACTGALAALTYIGVAGPWTLLAFTFLMAVGTAVGWPAMQAIQPETVEKDEVPAAIALGGIGYNMTRVIGPAIGGYVVALGGAAAVFGLNALSFLALLGVLAAWKRPPEPPDPIPREPLMLAMATGMKYVHHSPGLICVLVRGVLVITAGSCLWAVLPLVVRREMGLPAQGYGQLLGFLGAGAVAGAMLLDRIRARLSAGTIISVASAGIAAQLAVLAHTRGLHSVRAAMFFGGVAWTLALTTLNVSVMRMAPAWVRSRAAATYLLVFTGSMAFGSMLWGAVAVRAGGPGPALGWAGLALALSIPVQALLAIPEEEAVGDLSPRDCGPVHDIAAENGAVDDKRRVLVTIEYIVREEDDAAFAGALLAMRHIRLRDTATDWGHWSDMNDPRLHLESYIVESWADHLRQNERMTVADDAVKEQVLALHQGPERPAVRHRLAR